MKAAFQKITAHQKWRPFFSAFILFALLAGGLYGLAFFSAENVKLAQELKDGRGQLSEAKNKIAELENIRTQFEAENTNLAEALQAEKEKNSAFEGQIQQIAGTVGTIQKRVTTDAELLQKYSKVYFLNEHYVPQSLALIPEEYLYEKDRAAQVHTNAWPFLGRMLRAAEEERMGLRVISAYRSFGTQASLKSGYSVTYGAGTANQFSADQGYSEHQLGTAVDFTTQALGAAFTNFSKDSAYAWLQKNAYRYGFVLSYPEKNVYYKFEPWHWRFVGLGLAAKLFNEGKYFYDLPQRDINEFLVSIFDENAS